MSMVAGDHSLISTSRLLPSTPVLRFSFVLYVPIPITRQAGSGIHDLIGTSRREVARCLGAPAFSLK